jgi:hypothetical protein
VTHAVTRHTIRVEQWRRAVTRRVTPQHFLVKQWRTAVLRAAIASATATATAKALEEDERHLCSGICWIAGLSAEQQQLHQPVLAFSSSAAASATASASSKAPQEANGAAAPQHQLKR